MAERELAVFGSVLKRLVEVGERVSSEEEFGSLLDAITGIAGAVAASGTSVVVNEPASDGRHEAFLASLIEYVPRNIVCVPLKVQAGGAVVGVIEVLDKRGGDFTDGDRELLEVLAERVTPIVVRAREASLVD